MLEAHQRKHFVVGSLILVALLFVLLGFICAYMMGVTDWSGSATTVVWSLILAVLVIIIAILIFITAVFVVRDVEKTKLFQPTVLTHYPKSLQGEWYTLKHGGGLMNTTPHRNSPNIRRVLFLHGNSYELSKYQPALQTLEAQGYDVWAIEYAGFGKKDSTTKTTDPCFSHPHNLIVFCVLGITKPIDSAPNSESCLRDVMDAWKICGRKDCIVIGFSIGGAILGEVYEAFNPMPAQLVFLNTFDSFPQLVSDKLGSSILSPLLTTQWYVIVSRHTSLDKPNPFLCTQANTRTQTVSRQSYGGLHNGRCCGSSSTWQTLVQNLSYTSTSMHCPQIRWPSLFRAKSPGSMGQ
jgi:pimeloyl-ACP methyl ester carboxylesterase